MSEIEILATIAFFCFAFGAIGSIAGELILMGMHKLGWLKPRQITVIHKIEYVEAQHDQ